MSGEFGRHSEKLFALNEVLFILAQKRTRIKGSSCAYELFSSI
jgi:hypothetical protein